SQTVLEIALHAGSLDSKSTARLRTLGTVSNLNLNLPVVYVPPGILLYALNGVLLAQPMSTEGKVSTKEPLRIAENVAGFSASERVLVYSQQNAAATLTTAVIAQLMWFDRNGKRTAAPGDRSDYVSVNLSPDDRRAVVTTQTPSTASLDVW